MKFFKVPPRVVVERERNFLSPVVRGSGAIAKFFKVPRRVVVENEIFKVPPRVLVERDRNFSKFRG
jgi:hypothetical protein